MKLGLTERGSASQNEYFQVETKEKKQHFYFTDDTRFHSEEKVETGKLKLSFADK